MLATRHGHSVGFRQIDDMDGQLTHSLGDPGARWRTQRAANREPVDPIVTRTSLLDIERRIASLTDLTENAGCPLAEA